MEILPGGLTSGTYVLATWTGERVEESEFEIEGTLPAGYEVVYDDVQKRVLLTDGSGGTPYEEWEAAHGIAGAGPDADSDGDGVINALEFVLGGKPAGADSNSSGLTPTLSDQGASLRFSFHLTDAAALMGPDVWTVETSSDLTDWTPAGELPGVNVTVTPDGVSPATGSSWSRVDVDLPKGEVRRFARLRVELP